MGTGRCEVCGVEELLPMLLVHTPEPWSDRKYLVCGPDCAEKILMNRMTSMWWRLVEERDTPDPEPGLFDEL